MNLVLKNLTATTLGTDAPTSLLAESLPIAGGALAALWVGRVCCPNSLAAGAELAGQFHFERLLPKPICVAICDRRAL